MFWGITPALDLIETYYKFKQPNPERTFNILLIGSLDCRHVLKTIARMYRHEKIKIKFHIVEATIESIAKQFLLLKIALLDPSILGLIRKTKTFMELYGNILLRPSIERFLKFHSLEMIKMISDYDYLHRVIPYVRFDLKYKERDYFENLLKFWSSSQEFNISAYWDQRLRKTLGVRYDTKAGAFDWDLNMRFHPMGGKLVSTQEYVNFRQNGIAFSWLESEVSKPNRSMVCIVLDNGQSFAHYGYLGDMQTGPFVCYGIDCEDEKYLASTHGINQYRATDVTERNLLQIFAEIIEQKEYCHQELNQLLMGQLILKLPETRVIETGSENSDPIKPASSNCIHLDNIDIEFISVSNMESIKFRKKFKNYFHLIYIANNHLKFIDSQLLTQISNNDCLFIFENQRYILDYRDKELEKYFEDIVNYLKDLNVKSFGKNDKFVDDFLTFTLSKVDD